MQICEAGTLTVLVKSLSKLLWAVIIGQWDETHSSIVHKASLQSLFGITVDLNI